MPFPGVTPSLSRRLAGPLPLSPLPVMDLAAIQQLLHMVASSNVAEVEVEQDGVRILVRRQPAQVQVQPAFGGFPLMGQGMGQMGMGGFPMMGQGMGMGQMGSPMGSQQPFPFPTGYPPAEGHAPSAPQAPAAPAPAPAPSAAPEPAEPEGESVNAPIVGTFYAAPSPDADPFVSVGSKVAEGDVLCIIEAMKLMNEIKAEKAGTVSAVLVENGDPVEYDQPLFVIG